MRGQDHRALAAERRQERAESHALLGVQPGRGLVHHEQPRVAHERLRDAHAPPHAAREPVDAPPRDIGQPHALQKPARLAAAFARVAHAFEHAHVVQEFERREIGIRLDVLRQVAERPLERAARAGVGQVAPVRQHAAARGRHDAAEDAHERGLARTVRPHEADHAGGQIQREVVEGTRLLAEILAQMVEGDEHGGSFLGSEACRGGARPTGCRSRVSAVCRARGKARLRWRARRPQARPCPPRMRTRPEAKPGPPPRQRSR